MNPRNDSGLTWPEVIVAVTIVGILLAVAIPAIEPRPRTGQMTRALSNMRQLHLATQTMALDGLLATNRAWAWPGDTGGTFSNWARNLVPDYLSTNDFCKLLSVHGLRLPNDVLPMGNTNAILVYAVTEEQDGSYVFLTTANFTNVSKGGTPLDKNAKPFGDKGFVVFRKGGDGAILMRSQWSNTNLIGSYTPLLK